MLYRPECTSPCPTLALSHTPPCLTIPFPTFSTDSGPHLRCPPCETDTRPKPPSVPCLHSLAQIRLCAGSSGARRSVWTVWWGSRSLTTSENVRHPGCCRLEARGRMFVNGRGEEHADAGKLCYSSQFFAGSGRRKNVSFLTLCSMKTQQSMIPGAGERVSQKVPLNWNCAALSWGEISEPSLWWALSHGSGMESLC